MMDLTASIEIGASAETLWGLLENIDEWWVNSNPEEHESLESLSGGSIIRQGMRLRLRESVAGVPCEAVGRIEELDRGRRVTWRSTEAVYRYFGIHLKIEEGVTWTLQPRNGTVRLSAHVWAVFPPTRRGRLFEWFAKRVLDAERKDYDHAMRELRYIKHRVEQGAEG